MSLHADEAAYCIRQIARSTALALASTDSCVRASHAGIAEAYGKRLVSLTKTEDTAGFHAVPAVPMVNEPEPAVQSDVMTLPAPCAFQPAQP